MPRIGKNILASTFYLYPTEEAAKAGHSMGGTGFFVAYLREREHRSNPHVYAVTNWHVAVRGGCSVIRLNCHDGSTDVLPFDPSDWRFMPGGDDIAVLRVQIDALKHHAAAIPTSLFVTKELLRYHTVGTGEDVFMVGRFMDHDGGEINLPAVRFGNISVLPTPIAVEELGRAREYYCIDLHSRSGFSGSPVFAYHTIGSDLTGNAVADLMKRISHDATGSPYIPTDFFKPYLGLLGIHCGQFDERWEIKRGKQKRRKTAAAEYVVGLSGMTMVSPSWSILETLELPELQKERAAVDADQGSMTNEGEAPGLEWAAPAKKPRVSVIRGRRFLKS